MSTTTTSSRARRATVAVAVAVFRTVPASTSAWVMTYVCVQVVRAPDASVAAGQVTPGSVGSTTADAVRVSAPVFATRKL